MKKQNIFRVTSLFITTLFFLFAGHGFAAEKVDKVILASPFSPLVMPMARIVENKLLDKVAGEVELVIWNTPDQLRAMITQGKVDFVSVPSNVASIFYNKDIKLKLVRVSIWGVFYIISNDPAVTSLADLKGEKIYVPFRGDQPDLMFQTICRNQSLDPLKDFDIQYVSSPLDITMSLIAGKVKHAVMIEPAAAMCIMKAKQKGMTFTRAIDIQKEYGKATGGSPRFPNAGVVALPNTLKKPAVVDAFLKAYDESVKWTVANPKEAALLAAKHVKGVNAVAFEEALKHTIFESVSGGDSQKELETMFNLFMALNPKSIGGKLPDEGFYQ
ncbi:MAG TPA: ABC transporter substrate-binding protein [Desulfocapsa sulfexigens]|nr:ABC transporter substrate-binding protein [Desulfocapsa sulfexigens]